MSFLAYIAPVSKNIRPLSITSRTLKYTIRYLVSTNRTADEKQNKSKQIHPQSTRRRVIVFDIDYTLCNTDFEKNEILSRVGPECPTIDWKYDMTYTHVFLPHLQILFGYLLKHEARVAFFSAAVRERNEFVIPELLASFYGTEKYEALRAKGQFNIHSRDDMRKGKHHEQGEGNYVKDLKAVIRDGESLSEMILVDDDPSYIAYDQHPFLSSVDLIGWEDTYDKVYFYKNLKNGVYYMLGIFKTAFEDEKYKELTLKDAFRQILPEKYYPADEADSFKRSMIDMGLSEVQKEVPDARLFGIPTVNEFDELDD